MAKFRKDKAKPLFRKSTPASLKLAVFILLSLGAMLVQQQTSLLDSFRDDLNAAVRPVQYIASLPGRLGEISTYFTSRHNLVQKNQRLQHKLLMINAEVQKLASLKSENTHIRKLLSSSKKMQNRVLLTRIIAASPDPYRHTVVLNKGKADGVQQGLTLIDSGGIMGQVVKAGPYSSTALLITDANSGVPVRVNRTGLQTVAEGTGSGLSLRLPYLPINTDIKPGDLLISSGMGGRFPAGYPVAKVSSVMVKPGQDFLAVQAQPTARLHKSREALIVWKKKHATPHVAARQQPGNQLQYIAEKAASKQP